MPLVKLFGHLRDYTNAPQVEIQGATVREVLAALCAGNAPLCQAILDGDALRPHVRVMINGRDIALAQGLDTLLDESDQLAIFPPIAGGSARRPGDVLPEEAV